MLSAAKWAKLPTNNEIQSRMLNRGKGPAVHSLRAQIDRREYSKYMKHVLELEENLDVKQAEIVDLSRVQGRPLEIKDAT